MKTKICARCKEEKPINKFGRDRSRNDGLYSYCKACSSISTHQYRLNNPERYRQKHRAYSREYRKTARGKYHSLKLNALYSVLFTVDEFVAWYNQQDLTCYYCRQGLVYEQRQPNELTIDRKDSNISYTLGNIVLACRRCNMVKSSWLTETQMLKIGREILG